MATAELQFAGKERADDPNAGIRLRASAKLDARPADAAAAASTSPSVPTATPERERSRRTWEALRATPEEIMQDKADLAKHDRAAVQLRKAAHAAKADADSARLLLNQADKDAYPAIAVWGLGAVALAAGFGWLMERRRAADYEAATPFAPSPFAPSSFAPSSLAPSSLAPAPAAESPSAASPSAASSLSSLAAAPDAGMPPEPPAAPDNLGADPVVDRDEASQWVDPSAAPATKLP